MPVQIEDRPSEVVKEEVIDILVHNYSHGYISSEAFERRLDTVIAASTNQAMLDEVSDLEQTPDDTIKKSKEESLSINYSNEATEEVTTLVSILGGSDLAGQWPVPKTIRVFSLFGGNDIDFTDARFSSPNVTIEVFSLFGGVDIYVPENVNVISKAFCILGGVSNKAASIAPRNAPTITVKGLVLLSGLDIKVKTTLKEKFVAFANQMKTMFDTKQP
jgi:hypothetical protein